MNWQTIAAVASVAAVVGGFFVWFWRRGWPAIQEMTRFKDRIMGVPANPRTGQHYEPGIFERLDRQDTMLQRIQAEVEDNHGGSLKDGVKDVRRQVASIEKKLDDHLATPPSSQTTNINITPPEAAP